MSTAWGIRCDTCKVDSPTWFTNAQGVVIECVENWAAIRAVRKLNLWWLELDILPYEDREDDGPGIFDFLEIHHEHELVLLDEYGRTHAEPVLESSTTP